MSRTGVLVVDDAVVVRRLVADARAGDTAIAVVGTVADGQVARTEVGRLAFDPVPTDSRMPGRRTR